ncbi:uncharacterized protein Dsimw501_GD28516 [Drosophila simulans]|uniref:Uncharacterized protein n=1 Tax=Drosophila simulans TaxID=7240 RepID=A0A0J9RSV1_DROSI|nr:uncharacterized protein Dsimw501_GD28516 [Drosophila simulans]
MSEKVEKEKESSTKEKVKEEIAKDDSTSVLTFDTHPYFPFLFDPYSSSKYGSQVRERKIDRCLKQLQDALKGGNKTANHSNPNPISSFKDKLFPSCIFLWIRIPRIHFPTL